MNPTFKNQTQIPKTAYGQLRRWLEAQIKDSRENDGAVPRDVTQGLYDEFRRLKAPGYLMQKFIKDMAAAGLIKPHPLGGWQRADAVDLSKEMLEELSEKQARESVEAINRNHKMIMDTQATKRLLIH